MTRKGVLEVVCFMLGGMLFCAAVPAVVWLPVGTSGFTTNVSWMQDYKRIKVNDLVLDGAGNVFAAANNGNNSGADAGGVTIFLAGGGKIDVDVNALGYPGGVTRLVVAGDGRVYGLQNWMEVNWNLDSGVDNRILRFNPDGSVDLIVNTGSRNQFDTPPFSRIQGMAVGGDGNLYYTKNGEGMLNTRNFFYRYNISTGMIESSPMNGSVDNGFYEGHRILDLVYAGNGWFAVISPQLGAWTLSAISWTDFRRYSTFSASDPGPYRDYGLGLAFDPIYNALWTAPRGANGRLILTRWNGTSGAAGLFTIPAGVGDSTNPAPGVLSNSMFHADVDSDIGDRWVSALAVHPDTGQAWISYAGDPSYSFFKRGRLSRYNQALDAVDEGQPEAGADVVGVTFGPYGEAYALVFNRSSGRYTVYAELYTLPIQYSSAGEAWRAYE